MSLLQSIEFPIQCLRFCLGNIVLHQYWMTNKNKKVLCLQIYILILVTMYFKAKKLTSMSPFPTVAVDDNVEYKNMLQCI